MCLGEVAQLSAVLLAQQSGLGAELSTAQTSGAEVGLRRPRREQLSFLLWDPVVLPWVLPLGKWKGFSGPEVQRSSGMNLQHLCKLEMCSSTDTGQLPLR